MKLTLIHLFPDLLNLYGDRGNIMTLRRRCLWRGIDFEVVSLGLEDRYDGSGDLIFIGGDQDREQEAVAADLARVKGDAIREAVDGGMPVLAVCGGYQLFQHYYRSATGTEMKGLGIFGAHTVHPGWDVDRCVGNVAVKWNGSILIGFENHGGRTFLDPGAQPLGTVLSGHGNNGRDRLEGCRYRNAIGTYMHGSLLPKNPAFADHLIAHALSRRHGQTQLPALDDRIEERAHDAVLRRTLRGRHR
jgi:lipid II isoglutaminyl synthase (glutamine-hydrolysing)